MVSAGITTVVVLVKIGTDSTGMPKVLAESSFLDVFLLLALCYGIYRKSRICAVLMVALLAVSTIYKMVALHSFGLWGVVIFGYFYVRAAIGTFRYHSLMEQVPQVEGSDVGHDGPVQLPQSPTTQPSPLKIVLWVVGAFFTLGVVGLFALLLVFAVVMPPVDVVPGSQLESKYTEAIRDLGILAESEPIVFFYTDAFIDFETGFYLLTDRRVIVYSSEFEEPLISVPFGEIAEIQTELSDSVFDDSMVNLMLDDGTFVYFPLSQENGGDRKFIEALSKRWDEAVEAEAVLESQERL